MTNVRRNPNAIRVLIADDSSAVRTALLRMLESDPDLEVVGFAVDGIDTIEQVLSLQPDVVTLDIQMPRTNGLETLARIMAETARPVIMLSSLTLEGARITLEALALGAFDFLPKPLAQDAGGLSALRKDLIAKIKIAAHSKLVGTGRSLQAKQNRTAWRPSNRMVTQPSILGIGASTGGPKALQELLMELPATLPSAILIVQHMPVGFTGQFADRLNQLCSLTVREAKGDERIEAGEVYVAPAGWHMSVGRRGIQTRIELSKTPAGSLHMPSVDALLTSMAHTFGSRAMGILLTGMGSDGALGMKAIRNAGGWTIGQDEESCTVYGMPRSAAEIDALSKVAPLNQMASEILTAFRPRPALSASAGSEP